MNVVSEPFASNGCFSGSTVLALSKYATLLPPYGYSSQITYMHAAISSFPRAVLVTSMISPTFLPVAHFSQCLLSNCSCCSLLKAARHKQLCDKVSVGPGVLPWSIFPQHDTTQDANSKDPSFGWKPSGFLNIAAPLNLGPLCHSCLPGVSVTSSRASIL
jgi:hypothetical protein